MSEKPISIDAPFGKGRLRLRADTVWRKTVIRFAFLIAVCTVTPVAVEIYAFGETVAQSKLNAWGDLDRLRVEIERRINRDIQLVRGLVSYVQVQPEIDQQEFEALSSYLLNNGENTIRNLALARDLIITHTYPLEENRTTIGIDYREVPSQLPLVMKAVEEDRIVLAGPLDLIQGGKGLIARFPITIEDPISREKHLWGIASMVFDFDRLMQTVGLEAVTEQYRIAFTHRDQSGADVSVFLGSDSILQDAPVSLDLSLVGADWGAHAIPVDGWPTASTILWPTITVSLIAFLVGAHLILVGMRFENALIRLAMELERAGKEADSARQVAEEANRAKTRFLANMSHELRTPLNAIIGFSQIMVGGIIGKMTNPKHIEYQQDILASSQHLLSVINDILDITRIEAGGIDLQDSEVEVQELVNAVLRLVRPKADQKLQKITADLGENLPSISGDNRLLRQALINLVGNSVKFTPEGGKISVTAKQDAEGGLNITVADTGRGIAPSDLEYIMDPFTQGRGEVDQANDGTGLGLSITKRILEAHGGSLKIESELGAWTRVTMYLPSYRVGKV